MAIKWIHQLVKCLVLPVLQFYTYVCRQCAICLWLCGTQTDIVGTDTVQLQGVLVSKLSCLYFFYSRLSPPAQKACVLDTADTTIMGTIKSPSTGFVIFN